MTFIINFLNMQLFNCMWHTQAFLCQLEITFSMFSGVNSISIPTKQLKETIHIVTTQKDTSTTAAQFTWLVRLWRFKVVPSHVTVLKMATWELLWSLTSTSTER